MSSHVMQLQHNAFEQMKSGKKTREYRLLDEKRRQIKLNDIIVFHDIENNSAAISTRVVGLLTYKSWYDCYEDFFVQDLSDRYENIEHAVQDTYQNWWPKDLEEKYGCLIIKIRLLNREE